MNTSLRISNGIAVARILSSFWIVSVNYMIPTLAYYSTDKIALSIIADKSFQNILDSGFTIANTIAVGIAASGWSGVVTFAVISGFSLWYSGIISGKFQLKEFGIRRFTQIYLPYLLACVVSLLVGWFILHLPLTDYTISGLLLGIARMINSAYNYNSPLWYITLLLMLYLVYPIFPMIYSKFKLWGLTVAMLLLSGIYLYLRFRFGVNYYLIYFTPIYPLMPFLVYFLAGIILCHLVVRIRPRLWFYIISVASVLSFVGCILIYWRLNPTDYYWLGGLATVWFMGIGCLMPESWNKVLRWLARGTFAVFLYHYIPVFLVAPRYQNLTSYYIVPMVLFFVVWLVGGSVFQKYLDRWVINPVTKAVNKDYAIK